MSSVDNHKLFFANLTSTQSQYVHGLIAIIATIKKQPMKYIGCFIFSQDRARYHHKLNLCR